MSTNKTYPPTLVVLPGSPYVLKAYFALESRDVHPKLHWLKLGDTKFLLPPPGLVPVLVWEDGTVVADSHEILKFFDTKLNTSSNKESLYAHPEAEKLEMLISEDFAYLMFWFVFCDLPRFTKSQFRKRISDLIPGWIQFLGYTPEYVLRNQREIRSQRVRKMLHLSEKDELTKEMVQAKFDEMLTDFNKRFEQSSTGWILGTKEMSAADCALAGQLERLTGPSGDIDWDGPMPDLFTNNETKNRWPHVAKFQETVRTKYPIVWKGKRVPKDIILPIPTLYKSPPGAWGKLMNLLS
jgi:glutathione S-transferase